MTFKPSDERRYVHHLVLEAFVGPRPPGMQVRHLNGKSHDNRLENLAYGTPEENAADRVIHGTATERLKVCARGHEMSGDNVMHGPKTSGKPRRQCRRCYNDARIRARRNKKGATK